MSRDDTNEVPHAASISSLGIGSLGTSLVEALNTLTSTTAADQGSVGGRLEVKDINSGETEKNVEPPRKRRKITLTADASDSILSTFGQAIVDSQKSVPSEVGGIPVGPQLVIRGTVNHYNRMGQTWRIVIDSAELREKGSVDTKKSKRSTGRNDDLEENTDTIDLGRAQVLVYNDR